MKPSQQAWKLFKKNFYPLALMQLLLFFFTLFFLVFVKGKIESYIRMIQEYQPLINTALSALEATEPTAVGQAYTVVQAMTRVTDQAVFFAFFVVPFALLVFWIFFQGMFWKSIKKNAIKNMIHYFAKITIPTAIILVGTVMYVTRKRHVVDFFTTYDVDVSKILFITFIALYFLTVFYAVLNNQSFFAAIKKTCAIAIKKCYKYVPLYLPLFVNSFILLFLLMITLTQKVAQDFIYLEIIPLILLILLFLGFSTYYKIFFQKIVEQEK